MASESPPTARTNADSQLRVLFVNQYFPPEVTASARVAGELTEDLARDHSVAVIAGRPSYVPGTAHAAVATTPVERVPSTAFSRNTLAGRFVNYLSFVVLATVAACRAERPDVVVVMTDPPILGVVGAVASLRHRCRLVQLCHDVYPDIASAVGVVTNPMIVRAWRALNRWVRARADRIVVVGRDMREKLTGEGCAKEKLAFVPVWASGEPLTPERRERVRAEHGWSDRFVVMHAGNVGLAQGLASLVPAFQALATTVPEMLFVIVGDGAGKAALVDAVRERRVQNVEFISQVPPAEATELMGAADIHLISLTPGLWGCAAPSKTYSVMAVGRPFVAAVDAGAEPALVADEFGCGWWTPAGDPRRLSQTLADLGENQLDEMGARARRGFEQRYRREACTSAISRLLLDLEAG